MREEEKKSKCPTKNFQGVEKGEKKNKCGISGVRKKKELKGKFQGKKIKVFLGRKFKVKILVTVKS